MKTLRTTIIALVIAIGSSVALTGCFVDDEEVFSQLETDPTADETAKTKTNDAQWD